MSRLLSLVQHDFRMQWRYRIIAAYIVVIGVTAAALYFLASYLPVWIFGLTVYSDYAALGFFFLGGLMLFEQAENTRSALAVSPVSGSDYLTAKIISLTTTALIASVILAIASQKPISWRLYLISVVLISIQYIGLGALMATKFKTITGYIIGSVFIFLPITLPCLLAFLDPMPIGFGLIPATAQLKLMFISFNDASVPSGHIAFLLSIALLSAIGSVWLGQRALKRQFGSKT